MAAIWNLSDSKNYRWYSPSEQSVVPCYENSSSVPKSTSNSSTDSNWQVGSVMLLVVFEQHTYSPISIWYAALKSWRYLIWKLISFSSCFHYSWTNQLKHFLTQDVAGTFRTIEHSSILNSWKWQWVYPVFRFVSPNQFGSLPKQFCFSCWQHHFQGHWEYS